MPRKWHFQAPFYGAWQGVGLEMITPIRGRKRVTFLPQDNVKFIRNDNPDKGTETVGVLEVVMEIVKVIRNDNPDKGTETFMRTFISKE